MDWRKNKNRYNDWSFYQGYDTMQSRYQSNPSSSIDPFLRYEVSYLKDRYGSDCRACYASFDVGSLQLCVRVQSRTDDQKVAVPYHLKCFFDKQRISSEAEISGFDSLRIADQKKIQKQISRTNVKVVLPKDAGKKGTKRKSESSGEVNVKMSAKALRDYGVEYSKSSRAMCCGCRQKILKDLVRCKKVIYNTEVGMNFGGQPLWHHLECFAKLQTDLGWYGDGSQLPGFTDLSAKDQATVRQAISPVALNNIPEIKKAKKSNDVEQKQAESLAKILEEQNLEFYANRDMLEKKLQPPKLVDLLKHNKQEVPKSEQEILNAAADLLTFGSLSKCPSCKTGQLMLRKGGYGCSGHVSDWAKCDYFVPYPERTVCKIPSWMPKSFTKIKPKVQDRVFRETDTAVTAQSSNIKPVDYTQPKVVREKPTLYLMEIVIVGRLSKTRPELKKIVEPLGGKITTKLQSNTAVVVSTQKDYDAMGEKILEAQRLGIQVVLEEFFDEIENGAVAVDYISKNCISSWGTDPATRINQHEVSVAKSSGMYTRAVPKTVKLKVINGTAVDPESGLVDSHHVFIENGVRYFATLNNVDIQAGKNSYYKLQVLEADNPSIERYYLFTSRGRIGTTIGTKDTTSYQSAAQAVKKFRKLYASLTGNVFGATTFQKKPGLYHPIDVQFDEEDNTSGNATIIQQPSKLAAPVQDLMRLLFDVNQMKKVMLEFDLDTDKMPLGKISSSQVMQAMTVLNQLSTLVKKNGKRAEFIGASNHFYSLIPHDFGTFMPPVINTLDTIKQKNEMLESLLEMEVAYSLMNRTNFQSSDVNRLDMHYDMLKTSVEQMEPGCAEYDLLAKYLRNTHAETHQMYTLDIQEIFRVSRAGEQKRFEPFEDLPNRKLLWHGSRLTNYVGILSHGLRIAPPEAPVSGYMFGKGIYFADMVSKSANYCATSQRNSTGLVMLCDVALGNSMECTVAENVVELPRGIHSVKGVGRTYPDPLESVHNDEGVEIPLGKPNIDLTVSSSLLYNEYIVYDVAQVQIKYLFKLKFNYKF